MGEADKLLTIERVLFLQVGSEVAFHEFCLIKHILVDAGATKEKDIAIVGNDTVYQSHRY